VFADGELSFSIREKVARASQKPDDASAPFVGACLQAIGGTDPDGGVGRAQARSYLNSAFQ
jgi:hypothetical protein